MFKNIIAPLAISYNPPERQAARSARSCETRLLDPWKQTVVKNFMKIQKFSFKKIHDVGCEMAAILSMPQCGHCGDR